jgi:hypothetical protein
VLRGRGAAARSADEDPGVPRRSARHSHHRLRRGPQRRWNSNGKKLVRRPKIVTSGAGAAALACLNLLVWLGAKRENIWVTDIDGVVHEGPQ